MLKQHLKMIRNQLIMKTTIFREPILYQILMILSNIEIHLYCIVNKMVFMLHRIPIVSFQLSKQIAINIKDENYKHEISRNVKCKHF